MLRLPSFGQDGTMNGKCIRRFDFFYPFSYFSLCFSVNTQTHFSCTQRNAYHLVFPDDAPAEDKLTLIGSSILIDILYAEQDNNNGGGGGGGGGGG